MKTGFINGELVYVLKSPGCISVNESVHYSEVQIIRHRDLIRMLNKLFKEVKNIGTNEKEVPRETASCMWQVLNIFAGSYAGNWHIPLEIRGEDTFILDEHQKRKEPRLCTGASNTSFRGKEADREECLPIEIANLLDSFIKD